MSIITARAVPAPPAGHESQLRDRAFVVFASLWALATLFHQAGWPGRHEGLPMYALTLTAIAVLLRPRSVPLFIGFALLQLCMVIYQLPHDASNHWVFTGLAAGAILLTWGTLAWRRRSLGVPGGELFVRFVPIGAWMLLVLYFYAVLHKLNRDFLTPGVSCATDLMARIAYTLPGLPMGNWADQLAIYGTLVVEAAIPVLLVIRRTRIYGALLGAAFHLSLIFDMRWVFYDFSSLVYAMYFLFVGEVVLSAMDRQELQGGTAGRLLGRLRAVVGGRAMRAGLIVLAAAVVLGAVYEQVTGYGPSDHPRLVWLLRHLPRLPFLIYGMLAISLLVLAWRQFRTEHTPHSLFTLRPGTLGAAMIPVVFLNGLAPYIGLKTENAFSMFSNLSTEGGRTNHLFMPVGFRVAGYQEDLVGVVASSNGYLQRLADRNDLLPFHTFRYMAGRAPGHSLTYVRNGVTHELQQIGESAELMARTPVMDKLLQFRRVQNHGGPTPCTH